MTIQEAVNQYVEFVREAMRDPKEPIRAHIAGEPRAGWTVSLSPTKVTDVMTGETRWLGEHTVIRSHEVFRPVQPPVRDNPES